MKTPLLTVDCVIFYHHSLVLIRRKNPPFEGHYALPGGFVDIGETVEAACHREILEETHLTLSSITLSGVYSDPKRDPRGHTVSIAYLGTCENIQTLKAGDDAREVALVTDWSQELLAFDHAKVITDAQHLYLNSLKHS